MSDLDELHRIAERFVALTDLMLDAAQAGQWEAFFSAHDAREAQMSILMDAAGDRLLIDLPELRPAFEAALQKSLQIDDLARARRDDLGDNLASLQTQRRLRSAYR